MGQTEIIRIVSKIALGSGLICSYWHLFTQYIYEIAICRGPSMEPTLYENDFVLVKKWKPYSVEKWDMVILKSPNNPEKFLCKRVIHLPGEWVSTKEFNLKLQKGMVWLEGDNLSNSIDSRDYGPIPLGLIEGKIVCKVWPTLKSF